MAAVTPPSSPSGSSLWRHAFAGMTLAITLLVGVYAGVWVDKRWDTEPWGVLAGAVLGMVVGFYNLLKEFKNTSN
jgi:F0F1-type ATP synthase assembly protein I